MTEFLTGQFIIWLPIVFYFAIFLTALFLYVNRNHPALSSKWLNIRNLIITVLAFRLLYAILVAAGQYYTWSLTKLGQYFLTSPLSQDVPQNFITKLFPDLFASNSGYFLYYAYGRFFLNPIILFTVAFAFWLFLKFLKKYRERFFDIAEVELGFLMAFLSGWPGFLIFIPLTFICVVLVSIFRGIVYKEAYTTLGYPMILAAAVCLIWGRILIDVLGLTVFRV